MVGCLAATQGSVQLVHVGVKEESVCLTADLIIVPLSKSPLFSPYLKTLQRKKAKTAAAVASSSFVQLRRRACSAYL